MKNLLTTALLIGALGLSATAQERRAERPERTPEEIATQRTEHLTTQLGLTAQQKEAVYGLQLEEATRQRKHLETRRAAAAEARQGRGEAMKQQRERQTALQRQLDEILTEEQRETLAAQRAERREAMRERRGDRQDRRQRDRGEQRSRRSPAASQN